MDLLDLAMAAAGAPWWLGWALIGSGVFTLGVAAGMWLR